MSVHVWLMRVDLPSAQLTGLTGVLDERERARAARLSLDANRRRFIAAHGVTRVIIGHWLSVPADRIGWRHGLHGKPELTGTPRGTQVNLSHSGDLALLAITEHRHCGVDVQALPDERQALRLATRYFPAEEARLVSAAPTAAERVRRFGLLWTRKEACVKVAGGRLTPGLRLRTSGVPADDGWLPVRDGTCRVRDLPVPPGFRAAVAVAGDEPGPLVRHWFPAELDHDLEPEPFAEPDTMAVQKCSTVRQAATSA